MTSVDPHDLDRFVRAQDGVYEQALAEIRAGRKQSHWMWFIFPQIDGLGSSAMAKRYGIRSADEARAYLRHPVLGPRLAEVANAALAIDGSSAREIFGPPDDMKLRSSATLFARVSPAGSVFEQLLAKFFDGKPDGETMRLLGDMPLTHRWYARPVFLVADLGVSLPFYLDMLGFEKAWHEADGTGTVCQVNRSDCEIILCQDAARTDRARLFIELTAEGLTAFRRELVDRSVPHGMTWWGYDAVQVFDPDGNELLFPIPA